MKAVVARGAHAFELEDVPEPGLDAAAVLRIEAAGVCAADRMIYAGTSPWSLAFPFIPGHEIVGRVERIDAPTAERWQIGVGDLVTVEVMVSCGSCALCNRGRHHLCRRGRHLGSGLPGGWAERLGLPDDARVWKVPDGLAADEAILTEPLACAVHAVRRASVDPSETVVVIGVGAIGAAAIAYLSVLNVSRLVAITTSAARAAVARELGAHEVLDSSSDDAKARLEALRDAFEIDVCLDFSGSPEAVALGLDVVAPGGRVLLYGVYRQSVSIDLNAVAEFKELEIRGGHLSPGAFPEALALLASRAVDARRLVTARHPLSRFRAALEENRHAAPAPLKTILLPQPTEARAEQDKSSIETVG